MRCGNCRGKVKYRDNVCPSCQHLLANDVKLRRIVLRVTALALACVILLGTGFVLGRVASIGAQDKDIAILYTGDVHCAVDEDIGYAGLVAYKDALLQRTPYVTLVDCGDALQGDAIATVSKGGYLTDIMNQTGYDFAVLGNHDFDYGINRLGELIAAADAQYLGCNLRFTGQGSNALQSVKPYELVSYGATTVAFIGVCTPESIVKSTPSHFMDDKGNFIYDFYGGDGSALYQVVQQTVDTCRSQGADYVIALAHLGTDETSAPFRSTDLIANTSGIDAVLDGHSHSVISCQMVENQQGVLVPLSATGEKLHNIGQLIITPSGVLSTGLIGDYPQKNQETQNYIESIKGSYQADLTRTVASSEVALTTQTPNGLRLVRCRETNLGDFCADAYRTVAGADVAIVNGGGIRADLPAGEITYGDLIAVHPFGNTLCMVETTGQKILDALEMASRAVMPQPDDGEDAIGESGGFLQVSGLRYTIDTSVESTVELDEYGMLLGCGANRRVTDVEILQPDGSYAPLEPTKSYTLASYNYLIKQGGDGLNLFMEDTLLINEGMLDYQVLITYIADTLGGSVGDAYRETQGRITIR